MVHSHQLCCTRWSQIFFFYFASLVPLVTNWLLAGRHSCFLPVGASPQGSLQDKLPSQVMSCRTCHPLCRILVPGNKSQVVTTMRKEGYTGHEDQVETIERPQSLCVTIFKLWICSSCQKKDLGMNCELSKLYVLEEWISYYHRITLPKYLTKI